MLLIRASVLGIIPHASVPVPSAVAIQVREDWREDTGGLCEQNRLEHADGVCLHVKETTKRQKKLPDA